jgi:hypothetical protein
MSPIFNLSLAATMARRGQARPGMAGLCRDWEKKIEARCILIISHVIYDLTCQQ